MSTLSIEKTVGQLVAEKPSRSRVFERWGVDYCCGGKQPLRTACANRGLDLDEIVRELEAEEARAETAPQADWNTASLSELADHIVSTHHAYLQEALPRLSFLIGKVSNAHGNKQPELYEIGEVFTHLRAELEQHTMKEERVLFPFIKQLETAQQRPSHHCGSVNNPIYVMEREHAAAGEALERMRALTQDYTPPAGACNTYRAMLDALAELEADMHQHVHKENNILFPRAAQREAQLTR